MGEGPAGESSTTSDEKPGPRPQEQLQDPERSTLPPALSSWVPSPARVSGRRRYRQRTGASNSRSKGIPAHAPAEAAGMGLVCAARAPIGWEGCQLLPYHLLWCLGQAFVTWAGAAELYQIQFEFRCPNPPRELRAWVSARPSPVTGSVQGSPKKRLLQASRAHGIASPLRSPLRPQ